jgi:hypothetical protein
MGGPACDEPRRPVQKLDVLAAPYLKTVMVEDISL